MRHIDRTIQLFETFMSVDFMLLEAEFNVDAFLNKLQSVTTLARRAGTPGEREAALEAIKRMGVRAKEEASAMSKDAAERFLKRVALVSSQTTEGGQSSNYVNPNSKKSQSSNYVNPNSKKMYDVNVWVYVFSLKKAGKIIEVANRGGLGFKYDIEYFSTNLNSKGKISLALYNWSDRDDSWNVTFRKATQEEIDSALGEKAAQGKTKTKDDTENRGDYSKKAGLWRVIDLAYFQDDKSDKAYGIATNGQKIFTFWGRRKGPYSVKNIDSMVEAIKIYRSKLAKGYEPVDSASKIKTAEDILQPHFT